MTDCIIAGLRSAWQQPTNETSIPTPMLEAQTSFLLCGSPQFSDARLQARAKSGGTEGVWREVLDKSSAGVEQVLAAISGAFAIGLRESSGRALLAVGAT